MKNLISFLLLSGILLVFSNCKKDNSDSNPTYFLTAKINGNSFSSTVITAIQTGPFIIITGLQGSDNALSLSVEESLSIGTYTFSLATQDIVAAGYGNSLPGGIAVDAESGSMTITQFDKSAKILSGTFEFSGTDANSGNPYNITEGKFNVTYL